MWAVCPRLWFVYWFLNIMAHFWAFVLRPSVPALSFFEFNFVNLKQLIVDIPLICKILLGEVEFF